MSRQALSLIVLVAASFAFTTQEANAEFSIGIGNGGIQIGGSHCPPKYCPPTYCPPTYCPPKYCPPTYCPPTYNPPVYQPSPQPVFPANGYNTKQVHPGSLFGR